MPSTTPTATRPTAPLPTEVVKWYRLMQETEALSHETGLGLGRTWGLINDGDYEGAKASLDEVRSYALPRNGQLHKSRPASVGPR